MEDLLKNKLFWICVGLLMFNACVFVVGKAVVDKAADEVMERLEKDYSPSPYGPGYDPDVVRPESMPQNRSHFEMKTVAETTNSPVVQVTYATAWRDDWERDRGFTQ